MPSDAACDEPQGAFDPRDIKYPVSFELRLIFSRKESAALAVSVPAALDRAGTAHGPLTVSDEAGKTYAKARVSVTFMDQDAMRATYAAIASLPGVKAVI
jgi:putative lipoic acid-binding regulatory protein